MPPLRLGPVELTPRALTPQDEMTALAALLPGLLLGGRVFDLPAGRPVHTPDHEPLEMRVRPSLPTVAQARVKHGAFAAPSRSATDGYWAKD